MVYILSLDQNICMYPCLSGVQLFIANAVFTLSETINIWKEDENANLVANVIKILETERDNFNLWKLSHNL